jgi:FG-GAP-like repeat
MFPRLRFGMTRCRCLIATVVFLRSATVALVAAPPAHPGWPSSPASVNAETPVAADLDGDGKLEILWGRRFGVSARHEDGTFVNGWPVTIYESPAGPPSIAEVGGAPIVGILSNDFNAGQGQVSLWRADATALPGWPKAIITGNTFVPHQLPLVLADVDGDGKPEVIYVSSTTADGTGRAVIHVDRIDGTSLPGWPVTLPVGSGNIYDGSPAVADVDGDERLDIAVATHQGKIFLFHDNGVLFQGWPQTQAGSFLISNSVSFADVNGDGQFELVVTTYNGQVGVYDTAGQLLPGWPRAVNGKPYPPAFSDFENDGRPGASPNDGKLEMVFGTLSGGLYVLRSDGTNFPGWPKFFSARVHSVALADLNADSKVDLLATDGERNVYAWNYDGTPVTGLGFPFQVPGDFGFYSGPIVADIDRDGLNEFFALGNGTIHVWDLPTTYNPLLARYPIFMGGNQHTSRYAPEPTVYSSETPVNAYTDHAIDFTVTGAGFLKGMRAFIGDREQTVSNVTGTSLTITADNVPIPLGNFALYPLRVTNINSGSSEPLLDAVRVWRSTTTPPPTPTPTASPTATPRPVLTAYTQSPAHSGGAGSDGLRITVADDFQLSEDATITRIRWWGGYFGAAPVPDLFTIRVFADAAGQPGPLIRTLDLWRVTSARTGANTGNSPEFEYAGDLRTPFSAKAGVRYWLSISNPLEVWVWERSQDHGLVGAARSLTDPINGPWQPYDLDFAFELESTSGGLANISTRGHVGTGDDALIAGIIVTGSNRTRVLVRALGPSLSALGVPGALANPTLSLKDSAGVTIAHNDDWKVSLTGGADILATGAAPTDDRESAVVATLDPNTSYTVVIYGIANGTGTAVAEVYDLDQGTVATLANISTRGLVQTGDGVMISGFIVRNPSGTVIVRALGPSLQAFGVTNALADPFVELRDSNGALLASNDNWRTDQEAEIIATQVPPTQDLESAIVARLPGGAYTCIIRDANGTNGVGVIEVYDLGP